MQIQIDLPDDLVARLGADPASASARARQLVVLDLLREGEISASEASGILGVSARTALDELARRWAPAIDHEPAAGPVVQRSPPTVPAGEADGFRRFFRDLAEQWTRDTRHVSSTLERITHPSYLRIIGFGFPAVPLILEELRREPAHWFAALRAITGEDPVPPEHRGQLGLMAEDWIGWAERSGRERVTRGH